MRFTVADITGAGPLTYQWRRGGEYLSEGGGMSGTTTDTLTIASVGKSDGGKYTCVVTNVARVTGTSNSIQLTVRKCCSLCVIHLLCVCQSLCVWHICKLGFCCIIVK